MKNIIGPPARKKDFYKRDYEIEEILRSLRKGENIQIASPRRIGKTSILYYFLDNSDKIDDFEFIGIDVESSSSVSSYYKKVLDVLLKSELFNEGSRFYKRTLSVIENIKSISIAGNGFELAKTSETDYFNDVKELLEKIDLGDEKLVLLVDEFTIALDNINKTHGEEETKYFLQSNRELRLNPKINEKVKFILTGSIGLNGLVERLELASTVNDLAVISVNPLDFEQGLEFSRQILKSEKLDFDEENVQYLLEKVSWLTPFFIKLVIHECRIICSKKKNSKLTNKVIDEAFNQSIDYKYNSYYDNYFTRLKASFKGNELSFLIDVLKEASMDEVSENRTIDLSVKHEVEELRRNLLRTLIFDGYLDFNKKYKIYYFISPLLKTWWYDNV